MRVATTHAASTTSSVVSATGGLAFGFDHRITATSAVASARIAKPWMNCTWTLAHTANTGTRRNRPRVRPDRYAIRTDRSTTMKKTTDTMNDLGPNTPVMARQATAVRPAARA